MLGRAILTKGRLYYDLDLEGWWRAHGIVRVWHEHGVHASRHLDTWCREARLRDGMILGHKVELHHVAFRCHDGAGRID